MVGYTSANLNFWHYIRFISGDRFWVQISTDSGSTWTTLQSYGSTQGGPTSFLNANISLAAYLGMPNLQVRYYYESNWGYCWAIDNVKISGTLSAALTWSPTTYLYTDAAATIPYTPGTATSFVYSKPLSTITYQATLTGSNGCSRSGVSTITVSPPTNAGTLGSTQLVCASGLPDNLILSGNVGNVVRWESADDAAFTINVTNIANTTNTLAYAQMGVINPTKYYRVLVKSGACNSLYSNVVSISMPVTTWNGTSWSAALTFSYSVFGLGWAGRGSYTQSGLYFQASGYNGTNTIATSGKYNGIAFSTSDNCGFARGGCAGSVI